LNNRKKSGLPKPGILRQGFLSFPGRARALGQPKRRFPAVSAAPVLFTKKVHEDIVNFMS